MEYLADIDEQWAPGSCKAFIYRIDGSSKLLQHNDIVYHLFRGVNRVLYRDDDELGKLLCVHAGGRCSYCSEDSVNVQEVFESCFYKR